MKDGAPIFLALATAVCWGTAPVFAKLGLAKADPLVGLTWRATVIAVVLVPILVATRGIGSFSQLEPRALALLAAEGILASLVGHFAYYWALKLGNPAQVTPLSAVFPLVTVLVVWLALSEPVTWKHAAGAALIVAGVIVVRV
jgi:transporter family protein